MQVQYLKSIKTPGHIAGQPGQIRDLPEEQANNLVRSGYVKPIKGAPVIATPQASEPPPNAVPAVEDSLPPAA